MEITKRLYFFSISFSLGGIGRSCGVKRERGQEPMDIECVWKKNRQKRREEKKQQT
jgi:hypothetical protein